MILDEKDLHDGLKFIVGEWQIDYVVNAFSNDLAHIPASEFKSDDGRDLTALTFSFFEDHTVKLTDTSAGKTTDGTWEQTGWSEFKYTVGDFFEIPDDSFRRGVETLNRQSDNLVFSLGFFAVALKKVADGSVTEEPDIGDIEPTEDDLSMKDIVGMYETAKAFAMVNDDFGLFTREEAEADLKRRLDAGEIDEDDIASALQAFSFKYEFTDDHRVVAWMSVPKGATEDDIKEAIEAGEISAYRDGMIALEEKEWKAVNGKYYYNTGEHREVFDEVKSPWDELTFDEEGYLNFGDGMTKLKKI